MNLFVCVLPAKVSVDGTHKVRIAMSHNSETRYYGTRFKVPSPKNIKNGRVVGKDIGNADYINVQLNNIIQRMYRAYDAIPNAECYTCSQLLKLIESSINKYVPVTFKDIAAEWMEIRKKKIAQSSVKTFNGAIKSFVEFAGEDYLFSTFNEKTVFAYEDYLLGCKAVSNQRKPLKKKLSNATINLRMGILRAIVKFAERKKYVYFDVDPFLNYEQKPSVVRNCFLDVETLRKIRDVKTDDYNVELCRDLLMLSFYLAGLNYSDMIAIDMKGDTISFMRGKTAHARKDGLKTTFTIQPEARKIINKYIGHDGKIHIKQMKDVKDISNFFDRHLLKLETLIESSVHIIYYSARKTFAQLANELGVQERVIKYCIGDALSSREKDMLMFYTQTTQQMADSAIRRVLDFVASNKTEEDIFNPRSTQNDTERQEL